MDPLSIIASIASLVGGVSQAALGCKRLVSSYNGAPQALFLIQTETRTIQTSLSFLQTLVTRDADKLEPLLSGNSLLADNFDISVTGCSVVFTDLGRELGDLPLAGDNVNLTWKERLGFVWKEQEMRIILEQMRSLSANLQSLFSILQLESTSRIEELLRQQVPALRPVKDNIESAASARMYATSGVSRQNSVRNSVVASTLGSQDFSFDDILVNSAVYRKTYMKWRGRSMAERIPAVLETSLESRYSWRDNEPGQTASVSNSSEWLIDFTDADQPVPVRATLPHSFQDLYQLATSVKESSHTPISGAKSEFSAQSLQMQGSLETLRAIGNEPETSPEPATNLYQSSLRPTILDSNNITVQEIPFEGCRHCHVGSQPFFELYSPASWTSSVYLPRGTRNLYGTRMIWEYAKASRYSRVGEHMQCLSVGWADNPKSSGLVQPVNIVTISTVDNPFPQDRLLPPDYAQGGLRTWISHPVLGRQNSRFDVHLNIRHIALHTETQSLDSVKSLATILQDAVDVIIVLLETENPLEAIDRPWLEKFLGDCGLPVIALHLDPTIDSISDFWTRSRSMAPEALAAALFPVDATVRCGQMTDVEVRECWWTAAAFAIATRHAITHSGLNFYCHDKSRFQDGRSLRKLDEFFNKKKNTLFFSEIAEATTTPWLPSLVEPGEERQVPYGEILRSPAHFYPGTTLSQSDLVEAMSAEALLEQRLEVKHALVGGVGRTNPCLLIELLNFGSNFSGPVHDCRSANKKDLEPSINRINRWLSKKLELTLDLVIFTDRARPLPVQDGIVVRDQAWRDYAEDFNRLYEDQSHDYVHSQFRDS